MKLINAAVAELIYDEEIIIVSTVITDFILLKILNHFALMIIELISSLNHQTVINRVIPKLMTD